jgi:predicted metalloprotease with PDZ domain
VKFDATDTPIFWYRPEGNGKYRVIRADLSVVEVDSPPEIPGAQALGDWERDVRVSRRPSPKPAAAAAYNVENLAPLVRQLGILPFSLRNELKVRVLPQSVAEKAGMRTGDRIAALYGIPVERIEHVAALWALVPFYAKAQTTLREEGVPLTIIRDEEQVEVTLPGDALQRFPNPTAQNGYDLESLAALLRQLGIESDSDEPTRNDLLNVRILPGSAAEKAGIRSGDRIIALAGGQVVRVKDVIGLLAWVPLDDEWWQSVGNEGARLTILREGEQIEVTLPRDVVKKLVRHLDQDGR